MNTAAHPTAAFDPRIVPARMTHSFLWSVRRELMEHRSVTLGPLIVTGLFLIGFCISPHVDPARNHDLMNSFDIAAGFIMGAAFLIAVFYSLEALHSERRDRSILFWKSMPVSDATTVLSKAAIPIVFLPVLSYVLTVLTQWTMLLLSSAVLAAHGMPVAPLWNTVPFFRNSVMLLYHLILIHGLWYAPMWAFLLLVSAWARRAPVLWAALPIVAIAGMEKIVFNTSRFLNFLGERISGDGSDVPFTSSNHSANQAMDMTADAMVTPAHLNFLHFLVNPGLWIGLLITAAFLYAAIQIRHRRSPL